MAGSGWFSYVISEVLLPPARGVRPGMTPEQKYLKD